MISIPDQDTSARTPLTCLQRGVPHAYAILFFSPNLRLGWLLLAISLLAPDIGLSGLTGAIAAGLIAMALGFDRAKIRNGYLLFNPLLVCLTLGLMNRSYAFSPSVFLMLWTAAVLGGLFNAVAMQQWFGQQFGLSAQSLPAMTFAYILYFLAFAVAGPSTLPATVTHDWINFTFLPSFWQSFFQTFGAMLFEPRVLPGILVFLALALTSPLAAILATASFVVGAGTMSLLGFSLGPEGVVWCGFNFLLCGIALGTAYFAPSRMSLMLALMGAFLTALVALAIATALRYFGLPASALPYNVVVLILVYALKQRSTTVGLYPSPVLGMLPEMAGRFVVLNAARFPHLHVPALNLPFKDECLVTQGANSSLTHQAPWNWALDLEITIKGRRWLENGETLEQYHTFDKLVLAPCSGTVAAVVGHVHDNAPGANNPEENWGNYVVIYDDAGYYVLLAHLRQGSPLVCAGQRIVSGQPIGRAGNSGRSPIPHLHLQVQEAAYPGAATRPFCLRNFMETATDGGLQKYRNSGLPAQGSRLAVPTPLPSLHALFCNWLPGEYRYRIATDTDLVREETLLLDFDAMGRFRFRSRQHTAQLTAFLSHNVLYAVDYEGSHESLLALIAVGLARVPCIADPDIVWEDSASTAPFYSGALRKMHDIVDPFFNPGLLSYRYAMHADETGFEIRCRLENDPPAPAAAPRRITTTLTSRFGIQRIEAQLGQATVTADLIDPAIAEQNSDTTPRRQEKTEPSEIFSA